MQSFLSVGLSPSAEATPSGDLMLPDPAGAAIKRSIARRLLFWFLMIALIPCALLTAVTALIASNALENSIRETLVRTAASKATELESYAQERLRDGRALSGEPDLIRAARDLGSIAGAAGAAETTSGLRKAVNADMSGVVGFLAHAAKAFGYSHLLVVDTTGRIVLAIDDSVPLGAGVVCVGWPPRM